MCNCRLGGKEMKKWGADFPELPPDYSWAPDGLDIDIIKMARVPRDYPDIEGGNKQTLISWFHNNKIKERSIIQDEHTFEQDVASQEEGLALMAMRIWLGMNEP
jgi:hypothetical protein